MKLYVFLDQNENIIYQVRAEQYSIALTIAKQGSLGKVNADTDFYSTEVTK